MGKKKKIIIILVSLLFATLSGGLLLHRIAKNNSDIAEMQKRITDLENQVFVIDNNEENTCDEKQETADNSENEEQIEEQEIENSIENQGTEEKEETNTPKETTKTLDELISSTDPEDWLQAAKRQEASEEQLIEIARKSMRISCYHTRGEDEAMQIAIAEAIAENPATTVAVMHEFKKSAINEVCRMGWRTSIDEMLTSTDPDDWLEATKQTDITEKQLISVAEKTLCLCYYRNYTMDEAKKLEITQSIAENPNTTKAVMEILETSDVDKVAEVAKEWLKQR